MRIADMNWMQVEEYLRRDDRAVLPLGSTEQQITLLTERWWGIPLQSYTWTRGWDEAERDAAVDRLRERGLLDGEDLTEAGRTLREGIESVTDRSDDPVLAALGDSVDELLELVEPWARAVVDSGGYPVDPSALGEHL